MVERETSCKQGLGPSRLPSGVGVVTSESLPIRLSMGLLCWNRFCPDEAENAQPVGSLIYFSAVTNGSFISLSLLL